MTLLELSEDIFQYVCTLNREVRAGATRSYGMVRADIERLLVEFIQRARTDGKLVDQARKMELPLIFFIDSVISNSSLSFAQQWNENRLAKDRNELAGDNRFFQLLTETMAERGEEAAERLAVFHTCLWLGFQGPHDRKPERLREYADQIMPRIAHLLDRDLNRKICEDAYSLVDRRSFIEPPSRRLFAMLAALIFLTLCTLVLYGVLYRMGSDRLASLFTTVDAEVAKSGKPQ